MIKHTRKPVAKTVSAAFLIVVGMGFTAAPTADDRDLEEGVGTVAVADRSSGECLMFIDYWEWDIIIFQRYHMHDHGIGWGDPAETEDPRGEWSLKGVEFRERDPHRLQRGYTRDHDTHVPCPEIGAN
ncbi:MAG: hypothetical protein F4107_06435 [Gemmatimonadetes bacterium]|nr:hypothetical protein [Gemmatimonadota bacterium]MYD13278.1 hypothetical protein [Gemmatimonadota bacterium]MYI65561.1 hypothetical protein [Gemmatimonadota bacterium]